jgi:hypothetical protein
MGVSSLPFGLQEGYGHSYKKRQFTKPESLITSRKQSITFPLELQVEKTKFLIARETATRKTLVSSSESLPKLKNNLSSMTL